MLAEALEELNSDIEISAVHIGMLGSGKIARVVSDFLEKAKLQNIVLDPVMKSSSGTDLIDASGARLLIERLLPLATMMTPNVDEAAFLTGLAVTSLDQMRQAAIKLHGMGAANVVITGGHLEKAIDLLSFTSRRGVEQEVFKSDKQRQTRRTEPDARSRLRWPAIWREVVDCRRPCYWPKLTSRLRLSMPTL